VPPVRTLSSHLIPRPPPSPLFPYTTLFRSLLPDALPRPREVVGLGGGRHDMGGDRRAAGRQLGEGGGVQVAVDGHGDRARYRGRSEEHTSELQSRGHLVCRLLLEKKKQKQE